MEMNMATVEERKYKESKEPEEIDESHTDRNNIMGNFAPEFMKHEKEDPKKKLAIVKRQMCGLDRVRNTVKRPRSALDAHENPHTLATSPIDQMKSPKMEMDMATVEKRKYVESEEPEEIDEFYTYRDTIMRNSTPRFVKHEGEEPGKRKGAGVGGVPFRTPALVPVDALAYLGLYRDSAKCADWTESGTLSRDPDLPSTPTRNHTPLQQAPLTR
jgi:hypothetical protein